MIKDSFSWQLFQKAKNSKAWKFFSNFEKNTLKLWQGSYTHLLLIGLNLPALKKTKFSSYLAGLFVLTYTIFPSSCLPIVSPLLYLLLALAFSVFLLYCTDSRTHHKNIASGIYVSLVSAGAIALLQWRQGHSITASFGSPANYSQFIILFFPYALAYTLMQASSLRKSLYAALLLPTTFIMTRTLGGYVSFGVSLLIFLVLIEWRFLAVAALESLFIIPTLSTDIIAFLKTSWRIEQTGKPIEDMVNISATVWNNAAGVGYAPFLSLFENAAEASVSSPALAPAIVFQLAFVLAFAFLWYIIRFVRKGLFIILKTRSTAKLYLAAGFAALVGSGLDGALEGGFLYPKTLLSYWIIIGLTASMVRLER